MNGTCHDQGGYPILSKIQKVKLGKSILFNIRYLIISLILVVRLYIL